MSKRPQVLQGELWRMLRAILLQLVWCSILFETNTGQIFASTGLPCTFVEFGGLVIDLECSRVAVILQECRPLVLPFFIALFLRGLIQI